MKNDDDVIAGRKNKAEPWSDPAWLSIPLQKHEYCNTINRRQQRLRRSSRQNMLPLFIYINLVLSRFVTIDWIAGDWLLFVVFSYMNKGLSGLGEGKTCLFLEN